MDRFFIKKSMSKKVLKPGDTTPASGQYEIIDEHGRRTGQEITSTKGNPLPPTPKPNQGLELVDPTKHKGK
jgi:hypothetical protein